MIFREIIEKNSLISCVNWWPYYAYHFTDVTNAVQILSSGILYSRIRANDKKLMNNDNASIKVINMTDGVASSYVRFYFRPKTPTQYYNEGYKHPAIRYCNDENANVPVPVFFVFDMNRLIQDPQTEFSEFSQAGRGSERLKGIDAFSKLDFDKIYSDGPAENTILKYRHAELLYPNFYCIDKSIKKIVCRNEIEKMTLLNMLRQYNEKQYEKYKNIICIHKKDMFEENGLFVQDVSYGDNSICFYFSDTYSKHQYIKRNIAHREKQNLNIDLTFKLMWKDSAQKDIMTVTVDETIDYEFPRPIILNNLPAYENASTLSIEIYIGMSCICNIARDLKDVIII